MITALSSYSVEVGLTLACVAVVVGMLPSHPPARARLVRVMALSLAAWAVANVSALMGAHDAPMLLLLSAAAATPAALAAPCLQAGNERGASTRVRPSIYVLLTGVVIATVHTSTLRGLAAGFMACSGVVAWAMWRSRAAGGARAVRRAVFTGLVGGVALMLVGALSSIGALDPVHIDAAGGAVSTLARQRQCAGLLFIALTLGSPLLPALPQWRGEQEGSPDLVLLRWLAWLPALRVVGEVGPSVAPVVWGEWATPFAWGWVGLASGMILFRGSAYQRVTPAAQRGDGWRAFSLAAGAAAMLGAWTGTAAGAVGAAFVWVAMALALSVACLWEVRASDPAVTEAARLPRLAVVGGAVALCVGGLGSPLSLGVPGVVRSLVSGESTQLPAGGAFAVMTVALVLLGSVVTVRELLAAADRAGGEARGREYMLGVVAGSLLLGGLLAAPLTTAEEQLVRPVEAQVQAIQQRRCRATTLRDSVNIQPVEAAMAPACETPSAALRAVYGLPVRADDLEPLAPKQGARR